MDDPHMGEPTTSKDIDDDSPPNLMIHEEDDDGYPNTPPVLERQDYYMENDDPEPDPVVEAPQIPNKWYIFRSEFYLPEKLYRINPSLHLPHSQTYLLDLICILCQRVCNEAYAASCYSNHRFCKDCILPRYEIAKYCPRCGDHMKEEPQPDPTFDNIIEILGYDTDKVNYVDLNPDDGDDWTESDSEEETEEEDEKPLCFSKSIRKDPMGDQRWIFDQERRKTLTKQDEEEIQEIENEERSPGSKKRKIVRDDDPPAYKYMSEHRQKDDPKWKNKRNLLASQNGVSEPLVFDKEKWMTVTSHDNYQKIPSRWDRKNLQKPLQNMVYKTFWDIKWPDNSPPTPPFGLTPSKLRDMKLASKARKKIWADPYLSKREKKISIHMFLTTSLEEPYDFPQINSSSDDDEPPQKFTKARFDYPSNYRKPRKDWRRLYDEEGNRKAPLKQKRKPANYIDARFKKWNRKWGEPTLLIREASVKSSIGFSELGRFYISVPDHAAVGHLRNYIHQKIALLRNIKLEYVAKRFLVEFYACIAHAPGKQVELIKCEQTEPAPPPPKQVQPLQSRPSKNQAFPILSKPMIVQTMNGRRYPYPYQQMKVTREPTVREIALKNLEKDGVFGKNTLKNVPTVTVHAGAPIEHVIALKSRSHSLIGHGGAYSPRFNYKPRSKPLHSSASRQTPLSGNMSQFQNGAPRGMTNQFAGFSLQQKPRITIPQSTPVQPDPSHSSGTRKFHAIIQDTPRLKAAGVNGIGSNTLPNGIPKMSAIRSAPLPTKNVAKPQQLQAVTIQGQPFVAIQGQFQGTGFQAPVQVKMPGTSNAGDESNIMLTPFINQQASDVQYMQITPEGKVIPLQTMFAITPPKLMNATNATFLQPMRNLNGEPYLQQVPVQPTVVQPILTTPQPNIPLTRGVGTGGRLKKSQTAYMLSYPHLPLNLFSRLSDLRKIRGLKKGARCAIFYSIRDAKDEEKMELPEPMVIPPLVKEPKKRYSTGTKRKSQRLREVKKEVKKEEID